MSDVGYLEHREKIPRQWTESGGHLLYEQDLLDCLELSIATSSPPKSATKSFLDGHINDGIICTGLKVSIPIDSPACRVAFRRDVRMTLYRCLEAMGEAEGLVDNKILREFLHLVVTNPHILKEESSVELLAQEVGKTIFTFMMKPIEELDIKQSLLDLSIDSLIAVEMRSWIRHTFRLELTVLEISGAVTLEDLGRILAEKLFAKHIFVEHEVEGNSHENESGKVEDPVA